MRSRKRATGLIGVTLLLWAQGSAAEPLPRAVQAPPTGDASEVEDEPPEPAAPSAPPPRPFSRAMPDAPALAPAESPPAERPRAERPPPPSTEPTFPEAAPSPPEGVPPEAPNPWTVRPVSVEGHLGFGAPFGLLGFGMEYLLSPAFSLGGGVGLGSGPGSSPGVHAAVIARARPARGKKNALVLGAGFSTGGYRRFSLDLGLSEGSLGSREVSADWAHFFQADIGWERRSEHGFLVRIGVGFAAMLNPGALKCTERSYSGGYGGYQTVPCNAFSNGERKEVLPTFDFALGHSF